MTSPDVHQDAEIAKRTERRWATISVIVMIVLPLMAAFAGIHQATMPQARVETIDPTRLHLAGEFIESNLGTAVEPDGVVTVRAIGQQYSFTPSCILVPAETPMMLRATSADVVHGIMIQNTNINTMLVPGYITALPARFDTPGEHPMPCQEFCGLGHEGMWAKVKVIDKASFLKMAADQRRLSCVE